MSAVADAKQVFEGLAGKTLTNAEILSVATNYNMSYGSAWLVDANPYDKRTHPTEYAAWPDNATPEQFATFALAQMRSQARKRLRDGRGIRFDRERNTLMQQAEEEL